jgi:hypothetical protein
MRSSGDEGNAAAFPRHEYEAIEGAVMESPRGRWFLQEFARRNRAADTLTLLDAIGRLQSTLTGGQSGQAPLAAEVISLALAIKSRRSEIAGVGDSDLADEPAIYVRIAEQAAKTGDELIAASQQLSWFVDELKSAAASDQQSGEIELSRQSLEKLADSQNIVSRRIAKAMALLSYLDDRIDALSTMFKRQAIEPKHLELVAEQEEPLKAGAPAAQPESTQKDGNSRIVIIRRPRSDGVEIPLSGELPEQRA